MRALLTLILALGLAAAAIVGVVSGRAPGPVIAIDRPGKLIGLATDLDVTVEAPGGLSEATIALEQADRRFEVFSLANPGDARITQETADRLRISQTVGRNRLPDLQAGPARLIVTAARPVLFGLRTRQSTEGRDVEVRLTPPRLAVLSMHHHVNHGGAEFVVYSVTPGDAESGVRVGEVTYPGYPAASAGITGATEDMRVAFFALLYDQDLATPIELHARDDAGNTARAPLDHRAFARTFRRSRIEIDDRFIERVVPAIVDQSPGLGVSPVDELLPLFLLVNGDLRERNAAQIAAFAAQTAPEKLWDGTFKQLGSSKVESAFADHRTYTYGGREVDQQVHLGFDLAVTARVPVLAANRGRVLFADYLGIYGNTVVLDHGLGVQSLYAHLSSIDVSPGDLVEKDAVLGRSGMTGLAAGDHLHFTMLLQGRPVTPVEWWDPKWTEDRIVRKIREASR